MADGNAGCDTDSVHVCHVKGPYTCQEKRHPPPTPQSAHAGAPTGMHVAGAESKCTIQGGEAVQQAVRAHTRACPHANAHAHAHAHANAHTHMYVPTRMPTRTCMGSHACPHACPHANAHAHANAHTHMYVPSRMPTRTCISPRVCPHACAYSGACPHAFCTCAYHQAHKNGHSHIAKCALTSRCAFICSGLGVYCFGIKRTMLKRRA